MLHRFHKIAFLAATLGLAAASFPNQAEARNVRNGTRTSVNAGGGNRNAGAGRSYNAGANRNVNAGANRNNNVNRNYNNNTNVNRNYNSNVNVHRDIDVDVDHDYHGYGGYHPVATAVGVAATVAVTAAVVGSVTRTLPPSCSTVVTAGVTYQNCGGTYYQPQYSGTQVSYVVVNAP